MRGDWYVTRAVVTHQSPITLLLLGNRDILMKVSIIGGGGRVGSNAAFAMQCAAIVSEIHLLDANEQMAQGEALDLLHGTSVAGDQKIYAGGYDKCADSDVVVIT